MTSNTPPDSLTMQVLYSNAEIGLLCAEAGVAMHFHTVTRAGNLPKKGQVIMVVFTEMVQGDYPTIEYSEITWNGGYGRFYTDSYDGLNHPAPKYKIPKLIY